MGSSLMDKGCDENILSRGGRKYCNIGSCHNVATRAMQEKDFHAIIALNCIE